MPGSHHMMPHRPSRPWEQFPGTILSTEGEHRGDLYRAKRQPRGNGSAAEFGDSTIHVS